MEVEAQARCRYSIPQLKSRYLPAQAWKKAARIHILLRIVTSSMRKMSCNREFGLKTTPGRSNRQTIGYNLFTIGDRDSRRCPGLWQLGRSSIRSIERNARRSPSSSLIFLPPILLSFAEVRDRIIHHSQFSATTYHRMTYSDTNRIIHRATRYQPEMVNKSSPPTGVAMMQVATGEGLKDSACCSTPANYSPRGLAAR